MIFDGGHMFTVGENTFFQSKSPASQPSYAVVFEDDGETGYVYAYDMNGEEPAIIDALHIYNDEAVVDKDKMCQIDFIWSQDGQAVFIGINKYTHAIFDFANRAGYCRNGFPESNGTWATNENRELTDQLVEQLYSTNK